MARGQLLFSIIASMQFCLFLCEEFQPVAFSAGLVQKGLYLKQYLPVIWDKVYTNVGGGYDSKTGIFTCPQAGVYVFHFHAVSEKGENVFLDLNLNRRYMVSLRGDANGGFSAASNTVILELSEGDKVHISTGFQTKTELYGKHYQVYSTFSGFLLSVSQNPYWTYG